MRDSRDDMTGDGENVDAKAALLADTANPLDVLRALRPGSLPEDAYQAVRAWAAAVCEMPEVERVLRRCWPADSYGSMAFRAPRLCSTRRFEKPKRRQAWKSRRRLSSRRGRSSQPRTVA